MARASTKLESESFVWLCRAVDPKADITSSRFNCWVESINGFRGSPRYAYCIYADSETMKSLLTGDSPTSTKSGDIENPRAFVKLLDHQWSEDVEQLGPERY